MLTYQTLSIPFLAVMAVACLALTTALMGAFRKFAIAKKRLDVPNERSMHTLPVPRGGGIAIVLVFSLATLSLAAMRGDMWLLAAALVFPGALVAAIGWMDDRSHVSAGLRLLIHIAACAIAVGLVVDAAWPVARFFWPFEPGSPYRPLTVAEYASAAAAAIACAYLLNLYNFMDGLDGLAVSEGAFAGLAGGILILTKEARFWWNSSGPTSGVPPYHPQAAAVCAILLGVCCLGFLTWNWPPAKIFMGDVGSGFLGFAFATLIFASAWIDFGLLWPWLILLAAFISDATYTLIVRVFTRQRFFEAHRLHTFQKLGLKWGSHLKVTSAFWVVNIVWLLPLAYFATQNRQLGPLLTAVAYAPLLAVASITGAGLPDEEETEPEEPA